MTRAPALFAASLLACGSAHPAATPTGPTHATVVAASSEAPSPSALDALRARMVANDADALAVAGLRLASAGRARELTGEPAGDERVAHATVLTREGEAAAILLLTSCGNATLAGLHWDGHHWTRGEHVELVAGERPGQCAQSTVRGDALALASDARREIAIALTTQDTTGSELRGPFLSVFQLGPDGSLHALLRDAPFGAIDDATGATTVGSFAVVEDIPPPRPLHVSIRPGHQGPGGAPAAEIVERTYILHGDRLELANEQTESAE